MADFVDKAQHKTEELTGQAKEKVGDATGNDNLRGDGAADQVKAKARQVGDTLSDGIDALQEKSSDAVDTASDAAGALADKATTATSRAADSITDLADSAAKKAREADVDVGSIVDTSTSPRVLAAAALAGVGLVALVLYRRSRRQNVPQVVAQTRRAAKKLAQSPRR